MSKTIILLVSLLALVAYSHEHDDDIDDYAREVHEMQVLLRMGDFAKFIDDITELYYRDFFYSQEGEECYPEMEDVFVILANRYVEIRIRHQVGPSPKVYLENKIRELKGRDHDVCYEEIAKSSIKDINEAENPSYKPSDFEDLIPIPDLDENVWKDEDFRDYWQLWKDEDFYTEWQHWKDEDPYGDFRDWGDIDYDP